MAIGILNAGEKKHFTDEKINSGTRKKNKTVRARGGWRARVGGEPRKKTLLKKTSGGEKECSITTGGKRQHESFLREKGTRGGAKL